MKRALVVVRDSTLRETILDILHESGFVAIGGSYGQLTVAVLRRIQEPIVTIVDEASVVALDAEGALDDHARIVLMTGKDRVALRTVNLYGHLRAYLPVPCNVDDLVQLTEAAYTCTGALDSTVASGCAC